MKHAPSLFRRRLKAKIQAQKKIRLEASRRIVALGGTMPDLERHQAPQG